MNQSETFPIRQKAKEQYAAHLMWFAEQWIPKWIMHAYGDESPNITVTGDLVKSSEDWSPHCEITIECDYHLVCLKFGKLEWGADGKLQIPAINNSDRVISHGIAYGGHVRDLASHARSEFPRMFPSDFGSMTAEEWVYRTKGANACDH